MKKLVLFGLALLVTCFATLSFAASPTVAGSWRIYFRLEPLRSAGGIQCVTFTTVPGTVSGVPTSGTWTSSTFPGWFGQWIQLGDHVRWFGITGTGLSTTESGNMIYGNLFGGVSFNHYSSATAVTSTAGSWYGFRVASCDGINGTAQGADPAGK